MSHDKSVSIQNDLFLTMSYLPAVDLSMSGSSLKDAQVAAIQRMLSFNDAKDDHHDSSSDNVSQWKILVYDKHCQSIISPIFTVPALRKHGVTLHLLLESPREKIPDVPAIYFCQPTPANLARIAQDCHAKLYRHVHLNFCTKIERTLMEDFAKLVVSTTSSTATPQAALAQIASVHDQYIDYVCYENRLFSMSVPQSYVLYNSPSATEQDLEQAMTNISYGLFSVVATLGQVPIIRCPKVRKH
jgi:sec1 family domain-containing protein 1